MYIYVATPVKIVFVERVFLGVFWKVIWSIKLLFISALCYVSPFCLNTNHVPFIYSQVFKGLLTKQNIYSENEKKNIFWSIEHKNKEASWPWDLGPQKRFFGQKKRYAKIYKRRLCAMHYCAELLIFANFSANSPPYAKNDLNR
jgi:hypothetical protein